MNAPEIPVIEQFYQAFRSRNPEAMQALYHPQATFSDPVFSKLTCVEVCAMWHMLLSAGKDLQISYGDIQYLGTIQTCEWQARYTFSRTGRRVHNIIQAEMEMRDGLIYRHTDVFDFWRWSRQALGTSGLILGWTPVLRKKVRSAARKSLDTFISRQHST